MIFQREAVSPKTTSEERGLLFQPHHQTSLSPNHLYSVCWALLVPTLVQWKITHHKVVKRKRQNWMCSGREADLKVGKGSLMVPRLLFEETLADTITATYTHLSSVAPFLWKRNSERVALLFVDAVTFQRPYVQTQGSPLAQTWIMGPIFNSPPSVYGMVVVLLVLTHLRSDCKPTVKDSCFNALFYYRIPFLTTQSLPLKGSRSIIAVLNEICTTADIKTNGFYVYWQTEIYRNVMSLILIYETYEQIIIIMCSSTFSIGP